MSDPRPEDRQLAQPRRALDGSNPLDALLANPEALAAFPVENLERIVTLQRQIREDDARQAYFVAFRDAQAELEPVGKDAWNDHTKSWYARVSTVMAAVDPIALRFGFSRSISTKESHISGWLCFVLTLRHVDGHSEKHMFDAPPDGTGAKGGSVMNPVQGAKSAYTYAEGALIAKVWGLQLAEHDDDGNAAGGTAVVPISVKQAQKIRAMMAEADADIGKFLAFYRVESVETLPKTSFNDAVSNLNAKLALKAADGAQRDMGSTEEATDVEAEEVPAEAPAADADDGTDGRPVVKGFKMTDGNYGAYVPVGTKVADEVLVMKHDGGWFPRVVAEIVDTVPNDHGHVRARTEARPK